MLENGLHDLTVTGTCFEYGMQNGCLHEEMAVEPQNPYAIAKNSLRKNVESLSLEFSFRFKWVRLFYMYGEGQSPNSLISQLDKALAANEKIFNMSGGMQIRDFLPITNMAENIVSIAIQADVLGIVNCCSGKPITVKDFVTNYLKANNKEIELNLGFYSYATYEPMEFWGDNKKLKLIVKQ
jgi:dTDP-6-deoxy-L-talose 4-dehydrogenase (NAD+)